MAETTNLEAITGEIKSRLDAVDTKIDDQIGDSALEQRIANQFDLLVADDDFVRKMRFTADPRLAGSKYARHGLGVSDVEMLYDILTSARALGMSKGPSEELQNAMNAVSEGRLVDAVSVKAADVHRAEEMFASGRMDAATFEDTIRAIDDYHGRAMDTAESGYGSQLIGAQYVSDLWAGARTQSRVFGLIPTFQMSDPTAYLPVEAAPPEMLFVSESTASDASNYDTSKTGSNRVTVTARKFIIHQMWSGEMEEDSIIAYIPFLRGQAQRSIAHYSDSLILNGDTTNAATGNINLDDADPADTKHYLAFDGLRHAALVDNTGNAVDHAGAAITYDALIDLRSLGVDATYLHDWGHPSNPSDFVYLVNPELGDAICKLDEVISIDKYGSAATVLTGEVGNIGRNPLIGTIAMSKTEADGKVSTTGSNNTESQVCAFNRRGFAVGLRRSLKVETERLPATDQNRIVYSMRLGLGRFSPTGAASGIEAATVLYEID